MFSNPAVAPNLWLDFLVAALVLGVFYLVGRALSGGRMHGGDPLERLVCELVVGALFAVGAGVTLIFQRIGLHTIVPVVLLTAAVLAWRRPHLAANLTQTRERWQLVLLVAAALGVAAAFNVWQYRWIESDGTVSYGHGDLGYFCTLAKGLETSHVSDGWAAATGSSLVEAGLAEDQWYHWGPIWLGMLIMRASGLPAIESVLMVGATVTFCLLILLSCAMVRALTRWNLGWSLVGGVVSVTTLSLQQVLFPGLLAKLPFGWLQHSWDSLVFQFSYQFEGVQLVFILLSWLRGRHGMALMMVLCATISSPQFVGGTGITAGTLMIFGLLRRDASMVKPAAAAVGTILLGWAFLHWVADVKMMTGLHAEGGGGLFGFTLSGLMKNSAHIAGDIGLGLLLGVQLVPGWLALMRIKREDLPPQTHLLGWLALSALVGGMAAYHLFEHAERHHFTAFPMSLVALPAAVWGLALCISRFTHWRRVLPVCLLCVAFVSGLRGLQMQRNKRLYTKLDATVLNELKQKLNGEPFGYFAKSDRPWWISKYSFLAAVLDTRCIRLNPIDGSDVANDYSRFYNTYKPMELAPFDKGESFESWCLKLARSLHIRHVVQTHYDPVPAPILKTCRPVFENRGFMVYEINPPPGAKPGANEGGD